MRNRHPVCCWCSMWARPSSGSKSFSCFLPSTSFLFFVSTVSKLIGCPVPGPASVLLLNETHKTMAINQRKSVESTLVDVTEGHCRSSSSSCGAAVRLEAEHLPLFYGQHTDSSCSSRLIDHPSTPVGCTITPASQLCCCCCRRLFRCCRRPISSKGPTGGSGITRPSVIFWYTRVESEATAHSSIGKPLSSTRRMLHIRDSMKFGGIWKVSVRDKEVTTGEGMEGMV